MSTLTNYEQLRSYWWNAHDNEKRGRVSLRVRDLRPRQHVDTQREILARLAAAKAKLNGSPIEAAPTIKPLAVERYIAGEPVSQEELPIFLRRQAG